MVLVNLPSKKTGPDMHELVKLYQLHRHPKICRKYKNEGCRFHFQRLFSKQTIVVEPLTSHLPENIKNLMLIERKKILS